MYINNPAEAFHQLLPDREWHNDVGMDHLPGFIKSRPDLLVKLQNGGHINSNFCVYKLVDNKLWRKLLDHIPCIQICPPAEPFHFMLPDREWHNDVSWEHLPATIKASPDLLNRLYRGEHIASKFVTYKLVNNRLGRKLHDHIPIVGFAKTQNVIGGAILEEEIGFGGQARVFRANYLNKKVAVKIALPSGGPEIESKDIIRFEREQDMLLTLTHPNIVSISATGTEKVISNNKIVKVPYIIMELMSGAVTISRDSPMPWQEVIRIGYDVARGLSAAHVKGIVHRDIKPANVLLSAEGIAKISDFGWAHFLESGYASKGFTPGYASPEHYDLSLIAGDDIPATQVDEVSDIYSFGVTLYQMLTGHLPYEGPPNGIPAFLKGRIPPEPFDCAAPEELRALVRSMISLRRDQRPRSVAQIIYLMEPLVKKGFGSDGAQGEGSKERSGQEYGSLEDVFDKLYRGKPNRGQDTYQQIELSPGEALKGTSRIIDVKSYQICPVCQGSGRVKNGVCSQCTGGGRMIRPRRLAVKIPPGVNNGKKIRLVGQGEPGAGGGSSGDLYLIIKVAAN